mmetsp:Transcript_15367/g.14970  ORF Transcript_15367/g.14970 Transcript_15367/m.14970 type:complete len:102 (+) Transcript_15367:1134-1439(+)
MGGHHIHQSIDAQQKSKFSQGEDPAKCAFEFESSQNKNSSAQSAFRLSKNNFSISNVVPQIQINQQKNKQFFQNRLQQINRGRKISSANPQLLLKEDEQRF